MTPSNEKSAQLLLDASGDKSGDVSRVTELETRVRELSDRESELLERVYAMKLENQVRVSLLEDCESTHSIVFLNMP